MSFSIRRFFPSPDRHFAPLLWSVPGTAWPWRNLSFPVTKLRAHPAIALCCGPSGVSFPTGPPRPARHTEWQLAQQSGRRKPSDITPAFAAADGTETPLSPVEQFTAGS